jgi:peptidoglycan/xylan/chitin deacetylase (PgdA/CDA1 family)
MSSTPLWPNGTKLAVMVTVMFEAWPEGKAPPYSPMASPLREGAIDLHGVSWAEYGGKTGIWRLMRILDDLGIKGTVAANARAVERFPEATEELVRRGHEVAGHGYTQDRLMPYYSPEEERAVIHKCATIIKDIARVRPVGWASPRMTPTEHTATFLAEHGFVWHGDYNDTDLPYVVNTSKGPIVALQHSDFTDNRVLRGNPRDFFQVYRDSFDFLYRTEPVGIINLTVHAHFGARPPMASSLVETLKHMKYHPGVWFARHDEVAECVIKRNDGR